MRGAHVSLMISSALLLVASVMIWRGAASRA
jgi:hypothetical protein